MLPFGVTIPATVPQTWEIPEGLMNYSVYCCKSLVRCWNVIILRNIQLSTLNKTWNGSLRTHYNTRLITMPKGHFIVNEGQSKLQKMYLLNGSFFEGQYGLRIPNISTKYVEFLQTDCKKIVYVFCTTCLMRIL